ncbi:hypothetical protein Tco_0164098 [Tanacetum coccineum]
MMAALLEMQSFLVSRPRTVTNVGHANSTYVSSIDRDVLNLHIFVELITLQFMTHKRHFWNTKLNMEYRLHFFMRGMNLRIIKNGRMWKFQTLKQRVRKSTRNTSHRGLVRSTQRNLEMVVLISMWRLETARKRKCRKFSDQWAGKKKRRKRWHHRHRQHMAMRRCLLD